MRLTDLQIKRLKAPERGQKTYFDEALPGFGVRVSQGGTKSFIVMYSHERRLRTIGRYPVMGLSEARIEAKRVQAELANPVALSPHKTPAISFDLAKTKFLADCDIRNKPSTAGEYRRLLQRYFHFDKDLDDLSRTDITAALEELGAGPSERKHAFVALRTMLNWCRKRGYIDTSPMPELSVKATPRSRILTDTELQALWARAEEYGYPYGRIVQLLVLTGQRRGEIAGLRRSWIEEGWISFPTGFAKNHREHTLPLGELAGELLGSLPEGTDLFFPARGRDETPFRGWSKAKGVFDEPLEIAPYTLHDLRRTFSSTMARLGTPIHVTEKLLNHVSGTISGVAAVYNRHSYLEEMRQAIDAYNGHIANLIGE